MEESIFITVEHFPSGWSCVSAIIYGQVEKTKYSADMNEWEMVKNFIRKHTDFEFQGTYSWSNACGCFVQLSPCGEGARLLHEVVGGYKITEWLEIGYEDEAEEEYEQVIDKDGHHIPLGLVIGY